MLAWRESPTDSGAPQNGVRDRNKSDYGEPAAGVRTPDKHAKMLKYFNNLAGATGLEPAASGVTGRRSNQLSYAPNQGVTRT